MAVPFVETKVTTPEGDHCVKEMVLIKGRTADLHWLTAAVHLKYRSLSHYWPLLEDIEKARDAHFGKRTQFSARNDTEGKHIPVTALFKIVVRDFELWIHTPRKELIYVEMTIESITFLMEQTSIDIAGAPKNAQPAAEPEEPDCESPKDVEGGQSDPDSDKDVPLEKKEIASIIGELTAISPDMVKVSWQPSRSSFFVKIGDEKGRAFPAPNFNKSLKKGDTSASLAKAREDALAWVQDRASRERTT